MIEALATKGFGLGIVVTALWLGFQHGIDWDHIAAITDITSSQEERRQSLLFGTLYALGHALVILVLGALAILAGEHLPSGIDSVMEKVVGVTLLVLGVYVFYSLIRHGRDFRLRSRWMLVFAGVRKGSRWVRGKLSLARSSRHASVPIEDADLAEEEPSLFHHGHHGKTGHHHHMRPERDDQIVQNYGRGTSFGVGMIHGIGAETPTQVAIVLGAATASKTAGVAALLAFVIGLVLSNSVVTLGTAYGFLRASQNFAIYATVGVIAGIFSLVIGTCFVAGISLPHVGKFFGG
jgi:cytochrome c biogenesis protein CcdA